MPMPLPLSWCLPSPGSARLRPFPERRVRAASLRLAAAALAAALAGCSTPRVAVEAHETFDSAATFTRTYAALDAQACEAARRALLSQGYIISLSNAQQVRGRKNFQPGVETHVQVEVNVVCAREGSAGHRTIAFVNAVQESFVLRKSNSSASLGVVPFGSVSLPFMGSEESLVKVGSATITSAAYYHRFFRLVERYLQSDAGQAVAPSPDDPSDPS